MSTARKLSSSIRTPRFSDRNLARLVRMTAGAKLRLLKSHKFPGGEPQVFMQPYYAKALLGIREIIRRGLPGIIDARAKCEGIAQVTRRSNSLRVIDSYLSSPHAKRRMKVLPGQRHQASIRTLEVRFSPHVIASEGDDVKYIYFHEKGMKCDPEEARLTLEFGYWVLSQSGVSASPNQLELIDLFSGSYFRGEPIRESSLQLLNELAEYIEEQWAIIEP